MSHIPAKVRAYLTYRATVNELSKLSDRELDDLVIKRFRSRTSREATPGPDVLLACNEHVRPPRRALLPSMV